jgi:soluble lytic murein transglycosylase
MADKRSRIKKVIISIAVLAALVAGYFYLPGVLGDEVFPLKYQDSIVKWCKEYNEDPFLVAGIIMQESAFNPNAESPTGARGLMQISPSTAKGIAEGTGFQNFSVDQLYNPDVSIQFGTWYIHVLKQEYGGNEVAALAAYNAGGGNADKWLREGLLQDPSTNGYADRVLNYKSVYEKLYQNELSLTAPATATASTPIVMKNVDSDSRNIVWGQALKNLVSLFYGTNTSSQ